MAPGGRYSAEGLRYRALLQALLTSPGGRPGASADRLPTRPRAQFRC